MRKNEWSTRYGAARRASDRKLLAEVEKQIAAEERTACQAEWANAVKDRNIGDDARAAIARAFGRPLQ